MTNRNLQTKSKKGHAVDALSLILGIAIGLMIAFGNQMLFMHNSSMSDTDRHLADVTAEKSLRKTFSDSSKKTVKATIECSPLLAKINTRDEEIRNRGVEINKKDAEIRSNKDDISRRDLQIQDLLRSAANATKTADLLRKRLAALENEIDNKDTAFVDGKIFPPTMSGYLHGVARVRKEEFLEKFDFGVPGVAEKGRDKNQAESLLLYTTPQAWPSGKGDTNYGGFPGPLLSTDNATSRCQSLHVVTVGRPREGGPECLAIVGHDPMFHIPRFIRNGTGFELVQRQTLKDKSLYSFEAEGDGTPARTHRHFLAKYLPYVDTLTTKLRPVLEKAAINNTIIIMVCSSYQSNLLLNFACFCRSKGIKTENIVVFATDEETEKIARELHFAVYYDETIFGRRRGEDHRNIVTVKVLACHIVNLMGYNLLFQDVDIVWYRNPLEFFHNPNKTISKFDIYFADDGARQIRLFPYSANTGFFYAHHNERTRHLFRSWLFNLDITWLTNGDQNAMNMILAEESSMTGLRVKTLLQEEFSCGNRIIEKKHQDFIQDVIKGKNKETYVLHINWTAKERKLGIMKQMGVWFARDDVCSSSESGRISVDAVDQSNDFMESCCSNEPVLGCFYADTPVYGTCSESELQ